MNNVLSASLGHKCPNFIRMYAVKHTNSGRLVNDDDGDDDDGDGDERAPHFLYVMEKADETLKDYIARCTKHESGVTPSFIRSCLFQLLFVLHMAQTTCEFQHNDLHFKNVLLKKLKNESSVCVFHHNGKAFVSREKYLVKLADFGLSRVKMPNGNIVHNERIGDMFCHTTDVQSLHVQLKNIRINWGVLDSTLREQERARLSSLKREMAKGVSGPEQLLDHEFFRGMITTEDSLIKDPTVLHFGQ